MATIEPHFTAAPKSMAERGRGYRLITLAMGGQAVVFIFLSGGVDVYYTSAYAVGVSALLLTVMVVTIAQFIRPVPGSMYDGRRDILMAKWEFVDPFGLPIPERQIYDGGFDLDLVTRWRDLRPTLILIASILLVIGAALVFLSVGYPVVPA